MSERWAVLDKYGEIDGGTFDDSEEAALHMLDCEEDLPHLAPFTVARIYTQAELDAAVAAEREACALVCDGFDACDPKHIADAIRARGGE